MKSEDDIGSSSKCQKRRSKSSYANSPSKRKRNGTNNESGKSNRNNIACKSDGISGLDGKGRKKESSSTRRNGRSGERRRSANGRSDDDDNDDETGDNEDKDHKISNKKNVKSNVKKGRNSKQSLIEGKCRPCASHDDKSTDNDDDDNSDDEEENAEDDDKGNNDENEYDDEDDDEESGDEIEDLKVSAKKKSKWIESFKTIVENDKGTLRLLRHYILWFTMKAAGASCIGDDFQETVDSKIKLESKLKYLMNTFQSQAWTIKLREDVRVYPEFVRIHARRSQRCEACNRKNPASVKVILNGMPYNKDTYETPDEDEIEDSIESGHVQYYMGCFCFTRTECFHILYHYGHSLYHKCKKKLEKEVEGKILNVATNESLVEEMYSKLKRCETEAENYLTKDGKRTNKRWERKYKGRPVYL